MKKVYILFLILLINLLNSGCSSPFEFYIINSSYTPYRLELYLLDPITETDDIIKYIKGEQKMLQFIPDTLKIARFKNKNEIFSRKSSWTLINNSEFVYLPGEKKIVYTIRPNTAILLQRSNNTLDFFYYKAIRIKPVVPDDDFFAGEQLYITSRLIPRVFKKRNINIYFFFQVGNLFYLDL